MLLGSLIGVTLSACALRDAGEEIYPQYADYSGREVDDVEFVDPDPFGGDSLQQLIETRPTRCRLIGLPICIPGTDIGREVNTLSLSTLEEDVTRLTRFYRQNGFFEATVQPEVIPESAADDSSDVRVEFLIDSREPMILDSLTLEGVEGIFPPDSLLADLPLQPGQRFDLGQFATAADTVLGALRRNGYAYADILRNYSVDTIADIASASLIAIPGPAVRVDSVIVRGADQVGRGAVMRQLAFEEGDLLRSSQLSQSQRNLFALDIVRFAAVTVPDDSLQVAPDDSTRSTVLIQISEAPVHVVEAAAGYGSISCFRGQSMWRSRSFGGGARQLRVEGTVSKIGSGRLGENICDAYDEAEDPFAGELDYQLTTEFTRPYFISPRNQATINLFVERLSEPAVYQRQARGGRLSVLRRFVSGDVGTLGIGVERARTEASLANFCAALLVCNPEDVLPLLESQWRNSLDASWARDRSDNPFNPTGGYQARSGISWATPLLLSDLDFVRWSGEGSIYREVREEWTLSGNVRLGSFFGTAALDAPGEDEDFDRSVLPPDERFFAGGANSVRGYAQNALGPGVYVADAQPDSFAPAGTPRFVPTGGTAVGTGSVELRFPSPLLSEFLRLATFVDAGSVRAGGLSDLTADWQVTPGLGIRITTPVGPVRLDVGYNSAGAPVAPLFLIDDGVYLRAEDDHTQSRSFWQRLQFHLAVGQPF